MIDIDDHGQARRGDPQTSRNAAYTVKPGSARYRLLEAHIWHQEDGLTDEEAMYAAALSPMSEYATRCSELVRAGYLVDTAWTRVGSSGMARMVRMITPAGLACFPDAPKSLLDTAPEQQSLAL